MERQKAKEPVKDEDGHKCCPCCGWIVYKDGYGGRCLTCCENCGQAILWGVKMKPVHELYAVALDFELLLEDHIANLKKYKERLCKEKNASALKSISKTLSAMEGDIKEYREWTERELEAMEK